MNVRLSGTLLVVIAGTLAITALAEVKSPPRETDTNFDNYKPLAALVATADKVVLYEGLPHQNWEADLLDAELKSKKTVQIHGFPFYAEPMELKAEDAKTLTTLFTTDGSLQKFGGYKRCGGFHPDYCIEWRIGKDVVRCHVCFGCQEAKVYGPQHELYCDVSDAAYKKFQQTLKSYRKQRPASKDRAAKGRG
jgi:hypothetical protein